jgi:hypothetical protein
MAPGSTPLRMRWHLACLLTAALIALPASEAGALSSDVFGNPEDFQIQPELNVFFPLDAGFRLILKLEPTFVPSESYSEASGNLYLSWLGAPMVRSKITPDLANERMLEFRVGGGYLATLDPGTVGSSTTLAVLAEATPRFFFRPLEILLANRNRFEARWKLDDGTTFSYRLRTRIQLEREFTLSHVYGISLIPFANTELVWSSSIAKWYQWRLEGGLQLAVHWFGRGQVIEAKASVITYLQPSRSYAPVLGVAWNQYF